MASKTENRRVNIYINDKAITDSGKAIRSEFNKARRELDAASKSADDYKQKLKRFKDADNALKTHRKELSNVNRGWQNFKTIAAGVVGANIIQGALSKLGSFLTGIVSGSAKLSDALADVQKTTGLTKEEVKDLSSELKNINTRTSRSELLLLAKEAGRLGIQGKSNIKSFVEEANQINVALGEDLGEGAVLSIGKMADAFGTGMLNIGSAINEVGANSKAQEQYLVDFTSRMQGIAVAADIGAADVIGYAATLDSLGLKAEMSATALNTFFMDFVKDTEMFADAAGFASGELEGLIGAEGTNAGFVAFLEKLKAGTGSTEEFLGKLEQLGVDGARGSQVFLTLSNNIEMVKDMQDISNKAFTEGVSLTNEYAIKNNNLAANLEKVQKYLAGMFVNGAIMQGVERFVNVFAEIVEIPVSETIEQEARDLRVLEMQIYDTNTSSEERKAIIKQLQEQYPKYLSNIDADKISNEDLSVSLKMVNDELMMKALLQKENERLEKAQNAEASRRDSKRELEVSLREKLLEIEEREGFEIDKNIGLAERAAIIKEKLQDVDKGFSLGDFFFGGDESDIDTYLQTIDQLDSFGEGYDDRLAKMMASRDEYAEQLRQEFGVGLETPTVDPTNLNATEDDETPTPAGLTDEQKEALAKKREEFLKAEAKLRADLEDMRVANVADDEQRAIDERALEYERRQAEIEESVASEATKNALLKQEKIAFENDIDAINEEYEQLRQEKATEKEEEEAAKKLEVAEALMNERELELSQAEARYDHLIEMAEGNKDAIVALEKKKMEELAAINEKHDKIASDGIQKKTQEEYDLIQQKWTQAQRFTNDTVNAIGGMMSFMGSSAEDMNDFQKAATIFQMGIDTAAAISSATAAAAADPKNALTFGASGAATFATILGMIFTNMARAKSMLSKESKPNFSAPNAPQFGKGGIPNGPSHSNGGLPVINPSTGEVEYVMEGGEPILSRQSYANNKGVVDAILNSNGQSIDMSFLNANQQPGINFERGGGSLGGSLDYSQIGGAVANALAPIYAELAAIKEKPAVVSLSQMKDAQRDLDQVRSLSGFKN